jgi:hypothetical protein
MPAIVTTTPLSVRFEFPDGTTWTARLDGLPNPRLAEDLAQGLPMLTHPLGGIAARATAGNYIGALRCMVRELTAAGFTGSAADLTRSILIRYWMSVTAFREADTRLLLTGYDSATGRLDAQVRAHLNGRALKTKPPYKPLAPYTEREWATLVERCQSIIADAHSAQRALLRASEDGTDPRLGGLSDGNLAWLLVRQGPLGRAQVSRWAGVTSYAVAQTNLGRVSRTLFPTTDVTFAYVLLFGAHTGIVPDGIADLGIPDIDWAGEATILLDYVKGRSGPQSLTLPRQAVRLLEQWLEHSAPLRRVVGEQLRSALWIRLNQGLGPTPTSEAGTPASRLVFRNGLSRRWAATHDLTVDGVPISLHRSRIRTTYQNLLSRRGWTGRTTIDPNHSAAVEGDHYLSVTTPSQQDAVEAIIEDGQADLLRKAQPPRVLTDEQAVDAASGLPQLAAEHGLDDAAITELLGGQRDVFVAACADQLASPFGPAGKPCPARPWVCLLCPLAVFLPRHLPNLLRLKGFFSRQFRQQPTTAFLAVFGPYAQRLETEILPRFDQQAVTAAAQTLDTEADTTTGGTIGGGVGVGELLPLRPEELA